MYEWVDTWIGTGRTKQSRRSSTSRWVKTMLLMVVLATPARAENDSPLEALAQRYWDARMQRYPTQATAIGDYRFNDKLDDVSSSARVRWRKKLQGFLDEVARLRADDFTEADLLTKNLLDRAVRDELLKMQSHLEYLVMEPLNGPHIWFPLILVSQPFRNEQDFRSYLARLHAFPKLVDATIENLREGDRRGIVAPAVSTRKVIPQLETHIVDDVKQSEFYKPHKRLEKMDAAFRDVALARLTTAIASDVVPAYRKLLRFVRDEYLPACRSTVGIGSVPGGDVIYQNQVYLHTTIRLAPDAIHDVGLSEVARIRAEMAKVQGEIGFAGSLDSFLAHMRTSKEFRFQSAEQLYEKAGALLARTKPLMPQLFGRLPKADCVMKKIEDFRAASSPAAYYNPPPEDASRPAYYYINLHAPTQRPTFTLEALTYHESVPGHHLQIALDQENKSLPSFRRYAGFTAYVEGWALYCEKLGYEIGGYRDPYSRFGQLTFEMWRACRLVVDTGMHHKGWSRQQAIGYMIANTSLAEVDIEAEVDRYISWPGQALAYKIGELRISALRRKAESVLGDRFDLRAFHDALLSGGAMPIDILDHRMERWIADSHKALSDSSSRVVSP